MGDAEFEKMLDRVVSVIGRDTAAVACIPAGFARADEGFAPVLCAANDNSLEWPFIPFPEGWTATN